MGVCGQNGQTCLMKSRAIFLDRDGVLNHPVRRNGKGYPPARVEDVKVYAGICDQLQRLKDRGFVLIVVTNQPDVARGMTSQSTVESINEAIAHQIPALDRFFVCFHDNIDGCDCRKPQPGMLIKGAAEFDVDLKRSYMIGDRRSDIEAGTAAGTLTIFIDRSYRELEPTTYTYKVCSTSEALKIIENESGHEEN